MVQPEWRAHPFCLLFSSSPPKVKKVGKALIIVLAAGEKEMKLNQIKG